VLGALFAILAAASFALNNAAMRRGVVTGSAVQGMAISVPAGVVCFLPIVIISGGLGRLVNFPPEAAAWMAGLGIVHFIIGRYGNYRANQAAGVNLTAPVVQLQVVVTLVLAVAVLREPCTLLQAFGGVLILAGSLITQRQPARARKSAGTDRGAPQASHFVPRYVAGYAFASLAALAYGTSPIMARFALADTGPATGVVGGLISYTAATAVMGAALLLPALRREARALSRGNLRWFAASGVFVAMAQGFFFAAIAVAPILVVVPILQLSLVFRVLFSTWLSRDYELFGPQVVAGTATCLIGSLTVAIDTDFLLRTLTVPEVIAEMLRWRI
jgi:drug/metabolite transporter (DMT)-like permease